MLGPFPNCDLGGCLPDPVPGVDLAQRKVATPWHLWSLASFTDQMSNRPQEQPLPRTQLLLGNSQLKERGLQMYLGILLGGDVMCLEWNPQCLFLVYELLNPLVQTGISEYLTYYVPRWAYSILSNRNCGFIGERWEYW